MHGAHVARNRPVAGNAAQAGLPGMDMAVYKTRQHDVARGVDDFSIGDISQGANRGYGSVLDKDVGGLSVGLTRFHGDNGSAADQYSGHAG